MSKQLTTSNLLILLITLCVCFFLFTGAIPVNAQPYESISALPGTGSVNLDDPTTYFINLFKIFVFVASVLAVIKLMLCGFQYMTSEAISSKENAKQCIWAVIFGLFLILLSYLILQVINPELNQLQFENIRSLIETGQSSTQPPQGNQPPFCYGGSVSYPGQAECEAARQAEISNLTQVRNDKQIIFSLQDSANCIPTTVGPCSNPDPINDPNPPPVWCFNKFFGPSFAERTVEGPFSDPTACFLVLNPIKAAAQNALNTAQTALDTVQSVPCSSSSSCP